MKFRRSTCSYRQLILGAAAFGAQAAQAGSVETDTASLSQLVAPDATLQILLRQQDGFFEGPTWVPEKGGFLVVSAIPDNQLLKFNPGGKVSILARNVVRAPSSTAIHDTLYTNRVLAGPNGTVYAGRHGLYLAEFGGDGIARYDLCTRRFQSVVSGARAPNFRYANDVVRGPGGDIYFSAHEGIFRIHKGRTMLFRAMAANGLAFTPDRKALYASDGLTVILKIAVNPDGSAGDAKLFLDTHGDPAKDEFLDGMKVDAFGNLWAVAPGGIWIINPQGERLGRILAPSVAMPTGAHARFTNLTFGGPKGSVLYLTAPGAVYSLQLARSATTAGASQRR